MKEIEELKHTIDGLNKKLAFVAAKQDALLEIVLGVYSETLPGEQMRVLAENVAHVFDDALQSAAADLPETLYFPRTAPLTSFEFHSYVQHLRRKMDVGNNLQ